MNRLLVRGVNWIGDSIMTLPALRELRRHWQDTHITLMVRPWVRELFEGQDCFDALITCDEQRCPRARLRQNVEIMRAGSFDAALLLPNALAPALQAAAAGIPKRLGYATDARGLFLTQTAQRPEKRYRRHQSYYYLHLIHALGLSPLDYRNSDDFRPDATLKYTVAMRDLAAATAERYGIPSDGLVVGINPGAFYGSAKRWFPERYALVADALVESHRAEILIFGSAGEARIADSIASAMKHPAKSLAGKTRLQELLHLLSRCNLLITNDSGPMHLASALDTPLLAVFGSTDVAATGPLSSRARVIRKEVACSPCLLRECPLDLRCFDLVSVRDVVVAARAQLDAHPSTR